MSSRRLILLGGGEHARSVIWAAQAADPDWLAGILDPGPVEATSVLTGLRRLGDDAALPSFVADHDFVLGIGAIGDARIRRKVVERASAAGARYAAVIHPGALVSPSATVAAGAVVLAGAVVGPGARIGAHAVVNTGAIVEHDCQIGDFAQVAPGAVLGGAVRVGTNAFVALGARVRDHVSIGDGALVGMGAVVVADVAPGARVLGIPARAAGGAA